MATGSDGTTRVKKTEEIDPMFKRLIVILALGAALLACTPSGGGSASPDLTTPTDMVEPSMSTESTMPSPESASPSP